MAAIKLVDKVRDKTKEVQTDLFDLLANLEKVQGMIQFGEQAVDLEIYETSGGGNCQCKTPYTELISVPYGDFSIHFIYEEKILPKRQGVLYTVTYSGITEGGGSKGNGTVAARILQAIEAEFPDQERFIELVYQNTSFDSSGIENSNPGLQLFGGKGQIFLEWRS